MERGWLVIDLPNPDPVFDARAAFASWLRDGPAPGLPSLEDYHCALDERAHPDVHWELSSWFWEQRLARDIVVGNLGLLRVSSFTYWHD